MIRVPFYLKISVEPVENPLPHVTNIGGTGRPVPFSQIDTQLRFLAMPVKGGEHHFVLLCSETIHVGVNEQQRRGNRGRRKKLAIAHELLRIFPGSISYMHTGSCRYYDTSN